MDLARIRHVDAVRKARGLPPLPESGPDWQALLRKFVRHQEACRKAGIVTFDEKAGFNPAQPRIPTGNPDGGRWTDSGGAGQNTMAVRRLGRDLTRLAGDLPPLRRLHPDSTYETDEKAKRSLEYWRGRPTEQIVESLRPGGDEALRVYPDGTVANGNTRIKILQERNYSIDELPRESQPRSGSRTVPRGGGGVGGIGRLPGGTGFGGGGGGNRWPWQ